MSRPRALSAAQEADIRRRYLAWETQDALAGAFNVSKSLISNVLKGCQRTGKRPAHLSKKRGRNPVRFEEPDRNTPLIGAPERIYYVARNRATDEYLRQQGRDGVLLAKPALFLSRRRGKQSLSLRTIEIADPSQWELVPVRIQIQLQAAE